MAVFTSLKQSQIFIGESLVCSDANIDLHYMLNIYQIMHGKFNIATTTVADAALDSDGCRGLS